MTPHLRAATCRVALVSVHIAAALYGVKKVAVAAPEEATPTLTTTPTFTAPLQAPEKEPETQEKFLEVAKDYFNQFKEIPAQKHWICLKNYFNQKCGSVMSLAPTPILFSISRSFYDVRA